MNAAWVTLLMMSLRAAPGPEAGSGPGAAPGSEAASGPEAAPDPGKEPEPSAPRLVAPQHPSRLQCKRPLEFGDFNTYDVVANQLLHRSELTRAQFACLVQQLIRTRDRRVRAHFVGRLQNALWEAVRRALLRLVRDPRMPPAMRRRIQHLLAHELSDNTVRGSAQVRYNFRWDRVVDRDAGLRTVYRYALHELQGTGTLALNIPFARWRLRSGAVLSASYLWGATEERPSTTPSSASTRQTQSYPALTASTSLSLTERKSRFRLQLASQVLRYWEPLADMLASRALVSGGLEVRKPWKTGLGVRVSGSWRADRFAPPLDADFNRQQIDRAALNAELSYHFGRLGILTTYALVDNDTTTAFNATLTRSDTGALLAHLRFKGGYVRFGGGGGAWRESFAQLDDPAPSLTQGAAAHGRVEVQWQPVQWLSGSVVAVVAANHSEGDFNGWYPSWSSSLAVTLSTRLISAQAAAGYSGLHRDLDHRQEKQMGWAWAEGALHTTDRWNLRAVVWGGQAVQTRYQAYDETWWGGSVTLGVRLHRLPELWVEASGSCSGYRYLEEALTRDLARVTAAVYATGRF